MKFLIDNLYLFVIALVSGGLLLWPLLKKGAGAVALTPLEATQLINHRNAIVVDVRDEKAFALGSLAGARNLPFAVIKERASELVRFKSRPVLVVCDSGQQSTRAVADFKALGFDEAHSLAGGVAGWKAAGLPLVIAGRDNTRVVAKETGRKPKGDQRGRSTRNVKRSTDGDVAPSAAAVEAESVVDVAAVETALPTPVKEHG